VDAIKRYLRFVEKQFKEAGILTRKDKHGNIEKDEYGRAIKVQAPPEER